jgi:hypothetical protein
MSRNSAGQPAPAWSLLALTAAVAMTVLTGLLGASAAVSPLPGRRLGWLPPYAMNVDPPPAVVSALMALSVLAGAAGLVGASRALRHGWQPDPRRLLAAGALAVAALAVLPPIGSADPKSYAAYGRMAATGRDPYVTTPAELAASGDPVGAAVESPWQRSPSVYGPLATAEQALVARAAGDSTRAAVGLLGLVNAAAFLGISTLLQCLAVTAARRRRVALLWSVNPLLLQQLVAGAHLDTLVVLAVVSALALSARRGSAAGLPAGIAAGIAAGSAAALKLPGGAVAVVMAWQARRSPARLAAVLTGVAAVVGTGYALIGVHGLDQVRRASRFVSLASPWRPLATVLDDRYPGARTVLSLCALGLTLALAGLLLRGLPGRDEPGLATVRATLALTLAFVLTATYQLPWYDGTAWALMALLPASVFDGILLAHTTVLSLAYIPGRDVMLPIALARTTEAARSGIAPFLLMGVLAWTILAVRSAPPLGYSSRQGE